MHFVNDDLVLGTLYTRFSAMFKQKVAWIESHENSKIEILQEFEIAKCFKGEEIFLNNALNWTKILQFLTTTSKNTQNVNKVECGKCKKRCVVPL